jgi:hypothetical protein
MENPNIKKFYQQSAKPFNYVPNDLVEGYPTIPPIMSGLMRIDPEAGNIWISAGNTLVSDWKLITGGGGGSSITIATNGTSNPIQNYLNLQQGTGITLTDDGTGTVTIDSASSTQVIMLDSNITFNADNIDQSLGILYFNTVLGKSYSFKAIISYSVSNNTIVGTDWGGHETGSGQYASEVYYSQVWPTAGVKTYASKSINIPVSATTYLTTTYSAGYNVAIVEGVLTNAKQPGTVSIMGAAKTTGGTLGETVTVYAGSTLVVNELP